jgi:hypothetical protein
MAVSYEVILDAERMPDTKWLESAIQGMERSFAFAGDYDFTSDSGWCPCRLGKVDCGFEWSLEPQSADGEFTHVAQLSFRSADADAMCVFLVAAHLAMIAGGMVITPDDERVGPDDALEWASAQLRRLKPSKKTSKTSKPPNARGRASKTKVMRTPFELLQDWLTSMMSATVEGVMRSTPDDPLVAIRFSTGAILKTRVWTVSDAEGAESSSTPTAFDRLITLLRSGAVTTAAYEPARFELQLTFPGGTWIIQPGAAALAWSERWELQHDGQRIHPDVDECALIAGPF